MDEHHQAVPSRTQIWHTLRFRFALWTAGLLLVILAGFGTFVYITMARSLAAAVDDLLRLNASQALSVVEFEDGQLDIPESFVEGPDTIQLRRQGFLLRILNPEGQVLHAFGSYPSLPVTQESVSAAGRQDTDLTTLIDPATGDAIRVYTVPIMADGRTAGIYQVGQTLTDVRGTLAKLLRILVISVPVLVLIAGSGGYLLAARALAPIDQITRTAHRISGEDLSARLSLPPTDDEVGRLAATFDGMLARLDEAFRRERRFTADASHELRTPLTAMQVILDVTREKRRTPAEYEQALSDLSEETNRLSRLTESLLLLARNNGQNAVSHLEVDLSILLMDIANSMRSLADHKGLELACQVPDRLPVWGNMDELIRLFANLLDNAIKYTGQGSINIAARRAADGSVEVTVQDTGIGISAEHLPRIFDRFYRVEASRTSDGLGLGLSIAREIVRSHGGTIRVNSEIGTGTTFVVCLPNL